MREIDMADPDLGLGDDGNVVPLVHRGSHVIGGTDFSDLNLTPAEATTLAEVLLELGAEELGELEADGYADLVGWADDEIGRQLANDGDAAGTWTSAGSPARTTNLAKSRD